MNCSNLITCFTSVPDNLIPAHLWWIDAVRALLRILIGVMFILILVPLLVWFERRVLSFMQQRQGPNRVGPEGILQTIADGVKLLMKEDIIPNSVDRTLYILAPIIMLIPALVTAGVLPWHPSKVWGAGAPDADIGVLYLLAWGSLAVYGIVMAGWSSNNKYSLLGGLRSSAQMISYELGMGLAILTVVLISGALTTTQIVLKTSTRCGSASSTSGTCCNCSRWALLRRLSISSRCLPRRTVHRSTCRKRKPSWSPATIPSTRR